MAGRDAPFRRFSRALAIVAIASLALGVHPAVAGPPRSAQVGFWTGQSGDTSVFTPQVWSALREGHGALYYALTYTTDFGPGATRSDALAIIRRANALGVTIKAWLLSPVSGGTFANENNADFYKKAVPALDAWRRVNHLHIDEAILDLELPVGYEAVTDATDPTKLAAYRGPLDAAHQCAAVRGYADIISYAHRHALQLSGSPVPFAVDDLYDGNMALADLLDLGPLLPLRYDHLYVQAYRTYSTAGPDYPANYLLDARRYFGRAGEMSLGDTTMNAPYTTAAALASDVSVAVALGATAIPIFDLEGTLGKIGAAGVLQVLRAGQRPATASQVAAAMTPTRAAAITKVFFAGLNATASAIAPSANAFPSGCRR